MRGPIVLGLVLASASFCLAGDQEPKPPTIPDLIRQLSSDDFHVRQQAAEQLGNLGLAARDAVPTLGQLLYDVYPDVRSSAAKALGQIGTPAIATLIEALKDHKCKGHARIANALAWIGPPAKEAVPILTELLKSNWEPTRMEALVALGEIGPDAQIALPAVVRLLAEPSERMREQALRTLKQIGPAAIPILKSALQDKSLALRLGTMRALAV